MQTANTEHVARIKELVDLAYNTQALGTFNKMIPESCQLSLVSADIWTAYNANAEEIDAILRKDFFNFVIPECDRPAEISDDVTAQKALITSQYYPLLKSFLLKSYLKINKLWEVNLVTFNPVENYDRIEESTTVRSGNQTDVRNEDGKEVERESKDGKDISTKITNGSYKSANGGEVSSTNTNADTSYDTNVINTQTAKDADNRTTTTTYNDLTDTTTITPGVSTTREHEFDNRQSQSVTTYNDVTDYVNSRIHGNVGVTKSTELLDDYINTYSKISFWSKFWSFFIEALASPDFDTLRSSYEDEL